MNYLAAFLSSLGPLSAGLMFLIFSSLSQRLREALRMRPYYLFYWLGFIFLLLPILLSLSAYIVGAWGFPNPPELTVYQLKALVLFLPMSIGSSLALYSTQRYWKWVWPELRSLHPGRRGR
jgi:hypothetical protein